MCSACATIRPRSSKSAVEQSRRSLMFAENAERTSTAPISSATARRDAADDLQLDLTLLSRHASRPSVRTIPSPHPPGGDPAGGAVELDEQPGPRRAERLRGGSSSSGPGRTSAVRTATSSTPARGRRSRSAPRARGGTPRRDRLPADRQLERLSAVTQVGFARRRQLPRLRERARDTTAPRRAAPRSRRGRAPRGRPRPRERAPSHPELLGELARVQRPGAAERDEREVARVVAALDRDDAKRTQHLGVDDRDDRRRVDPTEGALGRVPVELDPARELAPAAVRAAGSRP